MPSSQPEDKGDYVNMDPQMGINQCTDSMAFQIQHNALSSTDSYFPQAS